MHVPPFTDIEARYDVMQERVEVGSRTFDVARIRDINALVDAMGPDDFGPDERLPYFSTLWPAAIGMAGHILDYPDMDLAGPVIELGCGLGLVSIAAAARGADVLATDYEPDALAFAARNAELNGVSMRARFLDWRDIDDDLPTFATLLASDVLYEKRNVSPLCDAIERLLSREGVGLIGDPGRPEHTNFVEAIEARGFDVEIRRAAKTVLIEVKWP